MNECPVRGIIKIGTMEDLVAAVRSKAVLKSAESFAGVIEPGNEDDVCAHATARDFLTGGFAFTDGPNFREKRKLLNRLIRPEALDEMREDVILPAAERIMGAALDTPDADGYRSCELVSLLERIFLEFSAKLIGFQDVETDERMAQLRDCVFPLFAALQTKFFDDPESVIANGLEAKKTYTEQFYIPARDHWRGIAARIASGDLPDDAMPNNLMRMLVTEAHPSYRDEEVAIRDSIIMFVATVGTSAQALCSTINDLAGWFEQHPGDYEHRYDMEFLTAALEESIRLRSPFISYITREAAESFALPSGRGVHKGEQLHIQIPKANRDASVFGDDAMQFNPRRALKPGLNRYGVAFSSGPHQCLGLRIVLGNDGRSGSHVRLLQTLMRSGVKPDPREEPLILQMKLEEDAQTDIPSYIRYPVIFTNWGQ